MGNVVYIRRHSEQKNQSEIPLRSNRFFKLGDGWYFTAREGVTMGAYDSHELAEKAIADYIDFVNNAGPRVLKLLAAQRHAQAAAI